MPENLSIVEQLLTTVMQAGHMRIGPKSTSKRLLLTFLLSATAGSPFISCLNANSQPIQQSAGIELQTKPKLSVEADISRIERQFANKELSKADLNELVELVEKYPQNSHAHLLLGNCCDILGLPLQAIEQYRLAFKYGPNDVQSVLELVKALIRSGQLTAANNLLKQAMEKFPTDPQVLFWTGNALFKEKRYNEAAGLYEKALTTSTKPIVGLYSGLASLHLQQEHYAKAYELAGRDLFYDKNLPQANEVMGMVLYKVGKLEKACPFLAIAFKNEPNNFSIAFAYAQSLIWTAKYNEAFIPAIIALANNGNFQNASLAQKTLDEIIPRLSKRQIREDISIISRLPALQKNADIHLKLAQICLEKNMADLALRECFVAVKLNPNSAAAKYMLALILENYMHNYPLALQYMRQAQAISPYNSQIKQHLMRLEDRLTIVKSDWAWRIKDWLTKGYWQQTNYPS